VLFGDGAGAVTEQHAGAAIVPIENAGEGLGADHQRGRGEAVLDHAIGHRQAVDEAGTDSLHVEGRSPGHAELSLHSRRGGRKRLVRRGRRQDDEVEIGRLHPGMGQRPLRGLERQLRRHLAIGRDMALLDAGALLDPLVGGIHLLGKIGVGNHALRQIGAAPLNDRPNHALPPPACSAGVSVLDVTSRSLARLSTSLFLYS
jgi:hypothetical protein